MQQWISVKNGVQIWELKEEENCSIVTAKGVISFITTQWTDEWTSRLSLCHNWGTKVRVYWSDGECSIYDLI